LNSKVVITMLTICILATTIVTEPQTASILSDSSENPCSGAYLDKVVYNVINGGESEEVLSLQVGYIDVLDNTVDWVHKDTLDSDPDIGLYYQDSPGYGAITINCRDYPLNISGLRRAFAYAFDKVSVSSDIRDGQSIVHDSIVPRANGWCIEDDLPWHYYTSQPDIGNQILNNLGFAIDGGTGFRLAPNGSSFDIVVEYGVTGISQEIAETAVDALTLLHIDATTVLTSINALIAKIDNHEDYDMAFYGRLGSYNIDWLAYDYWSDYADVYLMNPSNFMNTSFDNWRDQLLYGTTYEDVFEAAAAMQRILHENVPIVVTYESRYLQAARVDDYSGYIEDYKWGVAGPWTNLKVHNNSGDAFGGTLTVGITEDIDTFNIFKIDERLEELITDNLCPFCTIQINDMMKGTEMKVRYIPDLLAESYRKGEE